MVVEVFKTNVIHPDHASMLVEQIHTVFGEYRANFDLDDCDKILRVVSHKGGIQVTDLVIFLNSLGFDAEVLSDDIPELLQS